MADDCCSRKGDTLAMLAQKADQRRVLIIVMAINFAMFVIEFGGGVLARSSAVMADSVDMFGDAVVYALIILLLGLAVVAEIADKLINGVPPSTTLMLVFGSSALLANLACLALLRRFRHHNVNMSSTFECSRNDVISNLAVLAAAGLVAATGSAWPDIAAGGLIALVFLRSAIRVLGSALQAWRHEDGA